MFNTRNIGQALANSRSMKGYKIKKRYRCTKRFFVLLGYLLLVLIVILSILFVDYASVMDKLGSFFSKLVTSNYWKAVFAD